MEYPTHFEWNKPNKTLRWLNPRRRKRKLDTMLRVQRQRMNMAGKKGTFKTPFEKLFEESQRLVRAQTEASQQPNIESRRRIRIYREPDREPIDKLAASMFWGQQKI